VLLVDLDPQGHSTVGLGVTVDPARTVRELLAEEALPLERVTYSTPIDGLAIVPATIRLEREARRLVDRHFREGILRDALAPATARVDWILIDCPPSLGLLVENAVVAANRVIVPVRSEARGADGLVDLLEVMEKLNRAVLPATRILRTMRHGAHTTSNTLIDDDLEEYRDRLFETVIPHCLDLNHAQAHSQDIFRFAPRSTGAAAYAQLAGEVTDLWAAANLRT
jgi:chromosome partitioning protein